ncbi:nucleotidyltransferase family protein [Paracraurococcus lichenis]|uniref:Nucleotidyltransferase domain-containing protein n=1 Tax=Paracraurococcus lichenis TaxID=3064888 RepID=A0ABT9E3X0_9PROT|nr:nucleotidyltransferase domain-containing protein [Paracraurococcus sp. LOR1-02]MDO9710834.1 nucleotidyltransferase domain-containing protein [Paracraurococcus sp. LOR1-02]
MRRDEAIARLKGQEAALRRLGVTGLWLFGSVARDEAGPRSDVDLFLDYEKGRLGLFGLMEAQDLAAAALGRKADVTTRDALHPVIRPGVEAAAIQVF